MLEKEIKFVTNENGEKVLVRKESAVVDAKALTYEIEKINRDMSNIIRQVEILQERYTELKAEREVYQKELDNSSIDEEDIFKIK